MINNKNTVKPKKLRILKTNYYLKRLLKKLRKRLVRRWQEMPLIRHNAVKDNSNLENRLHTSPKKIKHRMVSTTEEDKISRVKSFKVRSQCSDLNINQDFITLKKTPPLKNFSALIKPMRIFTLSRLICRLPILTKIFYYSEKSIQKSRTRPIVTINTGLSACIPEYKYEHTDFHNKRRSISRFNPDRIIHPYFDFVKKYPLFKKNSFNKSIKPEDSERNLHSFHKSSDNNLSKTCLDDIMQQIDNSTADLFKLKEDAKKLKKHLKNSESSQQETEYFIHQLQALEKKAIKIESLRIQAMMDIINIDTNSKDSEGKTLAHHLAEYGDFVLLRDLILSKKLNPFIKDNQGFLPKDTANNNRLSITAKHIENTQEFLRSLTPEGWAYYPELKSSFEFNIDTREYFMPRSNSFKETKTTGSSGNGNFTKSRYLIPDTNTSSNTKDLMELITEDENKPQILEHLFTYYLSKNPAINFKKTCNQAINYKKPFYLLLILNHFKNYYPTKPKRDFIESPLVCAINKDEQLFPFTILLLCNDRFKDLHITHESDECENVFNAANRLKESFYVFLLVKKEEKLINRIIDQKYPNISKEAIKRTINDPSLDEQYQLINLKFKELKNCIEHLLSIDEETPAQDRYSQINNIIRYINKHTNEIERDLQKLKETYNSIHQNLQTAHPNPHPQSYPYQGNPQANPTPQNLINFYGSYSQPYVYSQTSTHHHPYDPHLYPSHQNPQTAPNPQSYTSPGHPQASANPPTPQNLPHTLASYQAPQSSHQVSHSTNRCDFPVTPTILTTELNRGTGNS
ncbi:MAG: DUF3824 domain-containing protein [Candidatus Symbiodolus clandestinus]